MEILKPRFGHTGIVHKAKLDNSLNLYIHGGQNHFSGSFYSDFFLVKFKEEDELNKSQENVLEKHISKIEENLILLGATALEDKLQDNVKNDIQEFIEAGIGVWMITGDKLDTAESIGHSCKLFNDDTEVFKETRLITDLKD